MKHIATLVLGGADARLYVSGGAPVWLCDDKGIEDRLNALGVGDPDFGELSLASYVDRVCVSVGGSPVWRTDDLALLSSDIALGGPGSGNWGHAGRPGQRGGSMAKSSAMSISTGKDSMERRLEARLRAIWGDNKPPYNYQEHINSLAKTMREPNYSDPVYGKMFMALEYSGKLGVTYEQILGIMEKTKAEAEGLEIAKAGDEKLAEIEKAQFDAAQKKIADEHAAEVAAKKKKGGKEKLGDTVSVDPEQQEVYGVSGDAVYAVGAEVLMTAFGSSKVVPLDKFWDDTARSEHKAAICNELAKRVGVDSAVTSALIKSWAYTSNDNDLRALSIQEAISEEFGVPLSPWQKKKIAELRTHVDKLQQFRETARKEVAAYLEAGKTDMIPDALYQLHLNIYEYSAEVSFSDYGLSNLIRNFASSFGMFGGINNVASLEEFDQRVEGAFVNKMPEKLRAFVFDPGQSLAGNRGLLRKAVRAMYDMTQEHFKRYGITEIVVSRGIDFAGKGKNAPSGHVKYKGNAAESWTTKKRTARSFASGVHIMTARIPVSRVLGTAATGFGCLNEFEYVVLGGKNDTAYLTNLTRTDTPSFSVYV